MNGEFRSLQHISNILRDLDLARMRSRDVVDEGVERSDVSYHRFGRESGEGLREESEEMSVVERESCHGRFNGAHD